MPLYMLAHHIKPQVNINDRNIWICGYDSFCIIAMNLSLFVISSIFCLGNLGGIPRFASPAWRRGGGWLAGVWGVWGRGAEDVVSRNSVQFSETVISLNLTAQSCLITRRGQARGGRRINCFAEALAHPGSAAAPSLMPRPMLGCSFFPSSAPAFQ